MSASNSRWRTASSKSTWPSSRPCRISLAGRSKASCSHSSPTASIRSCRTSVTRTAATWRSAPTRSPTPTTPPASVRKMPASAPDFLKPMFAGKLITCYPADDDATLYLFHLIVQKYGWSWMDKYMATRPNFVQGHLPVARSVASGENVATFDASSSVWPFRREGKLAVIWSPVDETPVFTLTGGIFKEAPHPNAAKLYLTWFLAREQQGRLGSFSSRVDVPPPEGFQP